MRRRTPGTALVKQHNAVFIGIMETPHLVIAAAAGATMKDHNGLAMRIAALLVIEPVAVINTQHAMLERGDLRIQRA